MNFKFKTILAAVVLATSASAANAAIVELSSATAGNSELVFSAWNGDVGYTYDLLSALSTTSFIGNDSASNSTILTRAVIAPTLVSGPNGQILDVELTGLPFASAANVEWNFTGFDNRGRFRALLTADSSITATGIQNQRLNGAVTGISAYYPASNGFIPAANLLLDDTYAVTAVTDGSAYAGNLGNNFNNRTFDTTNALGTSSFLYFLAESVPGADSGLETTLIKQMATATGENLVISTYQQAGQWRLNLSVAQTAPIPEPETYAMLLAGLGMMGAVARRRKGQVK